MKYSKKNPKLINHIQSTIGNAWSEPDENIDDSCIQSKFHLNNLDRHNSEDILNSFLLTEKRPETYHMPSLNMLSKQDEVFLQTAHFEPMHFAQTWAEILGWKKAED